MPFTKWSVRAVAASLTVAVSLIIAPAAFAQQTNTAADFAPADSVFFATLTQVQKQYDLVANSRAVRRILEDEGLQEMMDELQAEGDFQQAKEQITSSPFYTLFRDARIDETALWGDARWVDLQAFVYGLNLQIYIDSAMAGVSGSQPNPARTILRSLRQNPELRIPSTVFATRYQNPAKIKELLEILKGLSAQLPPPFTVKSQTIADADYLTLSLSGEDIPMTRAEFTEAVANDDVLDEAAAGQLYDWLQTQTIAVGLGLRGEYLILSIAADLKPLEKLGESPIADREDWTPIKKHLSPSIVEIGYVSEKFEETAQIDAESINSAIDNFGFLAMIGGLPERLKKDGAELVKDLDAASTKPSSEVFVTLLDQGLKRIKYSRRLSPLVDYGRTMTSFGTPGPKPFLVGGCVLGDPTKCYQSVNKWIKRLWSYWTEIGKPMVGPQGEQVDQMFQQLFLPSLQSLDATLSESLLPAIGGGECSLVVDLSQKSDQLGPEQFPKEMPLPALAITQQLADGEKFAQAVAKVVQTIEEIVDQAGLMSNNPQMQQFRVPRPIAIRVEGGTKYSYPFPPLAGAVISPNATVAQHKLILSSSDPLSTRLLKNSSNAAHPLRNDKPMGSGVVCNVDVLIDALRDWAEYGINRSPGPAEQKEIVQKYTGMGLDLLGTIKQFSACSYEQDGYLVQESWLKIVDVTP